MKKISIIFACLIIVLFSATAYSAVPNGFRGVKWETNIKNLKGFKLIEETEDKLRIYARTSDKLSIGDASVKSISYVFYKDRLGAVMILSTGLTNAKLLLSTLQETYGSPHFSQEHKNQYSWSWDDKVEVLYSYNEYSDGLRILYSYEPIMSDEKGRDQKQQGIRGGEDL